MDFFIPYYDQYWQIYFPNIKTPFLAYDLAFLTGIISLKELENKFNIFYQIILSKKCWLNLIRKLKYISNESKKQYQNNLDKRIYYIDMILLSSFILCINLNNSDTSFIIDTSLGNNFLNLLKKSNISSDSNDIFKNKISFNVDETFWETESLYPKVQPQNQQVKDFENLVTIDLLTDTSNIILDYEKWLKNQKKTELYQIKIRFYINFITIIPEYRNEPKNKWGIMVVNKKIG